MTEQEIRVGGIYTGPAGSRSRQVMTNAALARVVARINHASAAAMHELAQGMWNPDFCSAAAEDSLRATRLMESLAPQIAALAGSCIPEYAVNWGVTEHLTEAVRRLEGKP